jgi:hypothetical protein
MEQNGLLVGSVVVQLWHRGEKVRFRRPEWDKTNVLVGVLSHAQVVAVLQGALDAMASPEGLEVLELKF